MGRIILLFLFSSFFIFSCDTKDDPKVPNHTNGLTTDANTMTFKNLIYTLGFRTCDVVDTFGNKHYLMTGADLNPKFYIWLILADSVAPSSSSTYSIQNITTVSSLNQGQCVLVMQDPSSSFMLKWTATDGILNLKMDGKPIAVVNNINFVCISDTSQHQIVSGNWQCH